MSFGRKGWVPQPCFLQFTPTRSRHSNHTCYLRTPIVCGRVPVVVFAPMSEFSFRLESMRHLSAYLMLVLGGNEKPTVYISLRPSNEVG